MIDPLRAFLEGHSLEAPVLPTTSRYYGLGTHVLTATDGRNLAYLRRRFLPQPERFTLLQEHALTEGDRVDNLAYRFLGDPEQYWRLCDANGVMRPAELTCDRNDPKAGDGRSRNVGRILRITLPEGVPGPSDD